MMQGVYPGTIFLILSILSIAALFFAIPTSTELRRKLIASGALIIMIGLGMLLAIEDGIQSSILPATLSSQNWSTVILQGFGWSLLGGFTVGAILLISIYFLSKKVLPQLRARFAEEREQPIWKRLVIAAYSGILEEIIFRLFLLSLLAWIVGIAWHTELMRPSIGALWISNLLSATAFGLVHLPRWSDLTKPTPKLVIAIMALNGLGGLVFGYLFITHGIGVAILAHIFGDTVLHTIGPEYLRS